MKSKTVVVNGVTYWRAAKEFDMTKTKPKPSPIAPPRTLYDIHMMPWRVGMPGNAPLMRLCDTLICDTRLSVDYRKQAMMFAGYLMTGIAEFVSDAMLAEYVNEARQTNAALKFTIPKQPGVRKAAKKKART